MSILAILIVAGTMAGCDGFFVDPTLSSLTVTPSTPSIQEGSTQQMTATGTYNDGSTKNITGSVYWSSSDTSVATVETGGLVTGVDTGTTTITATSGTITGSTTATVLLANLVSIQVTPTSTSISSGGTVQFMAIGTISGGAQYDITDSVTWSSSNTSAATISSEGLATAQTVSSTQKSNITATSGSIVSNTAVLAVYP